MYLERVELMGRVPASREPVGLVKTGSSTLLFDRFGDVASIFSMGCGWDTVALPYFVFERYVLSWAFNGVIYKGYVEDNVFNAMKHYSILFGTSFNKVKGGMLKI